MGENGACFFSAKAGVKEIERDWYSTITLFASLSGWSPPLQSPVPAAGGGGLFAEPSPADKRVPGDLSTNASDKENA